MNTILELLSIYDLNLNLLLITNKEFLKYKKEYYIFNLNYDMSIKYYEDINFRNKICGEILYLNKQLKLKLSNYNFNININNLSVLGNIHTLNLSHCENITDVSSLGNVYILILYSCNKITDVSALGNVYTLNLSHCKNIIDVSALGNFHYKKYVDFFSNQEFYLSDFHKKINDVSALSNVHTLILSNCHNIIDVSALGNVH